MKKMVTFVLTKTIYAMKKFLIALVALFAITTVASAAPYKLDEAAIDDVIENAVPVSPVALMAEIPASLPAGMPATASVSAGISGRAK